MTHEVHLLKLDERSDDGDRQDGQQTQLRAKHYEVGQVFIVVEHEIAADSDQGQRREEQTTKQTFVRLNNQFLVVHCSSYCQTIHCVSVKTIMPLFPINSTNYRLFKYDFLTIFLKINSG